MIINDPGTGGRLSAALSTGLSKGLEHLANNKLNEIQQRYRQAQYMNTFQQGGYSPEVSQVLSLMAQTDPKSLAKILPMLAPQEQQQMDMGGFGNEQQESPMQALQQQQQPGIDPQQAIRNALLGISPQQMGGLSSLQGQPQMPIQQHMAPQQMQQPKIQQQAQPRQTFAQALSQGNQNKPRNVADLKHEDAVIGQRQNLEDIISTADTMLNALKTNQVGSGFITSKIAENSPNLLNKPTELFDKDAAHLINLQSAEIKGVPSRFRVQLIEKEKPGVQHSNAINKQILTRTKKIAEQKLKELNARYGIQSQPQQSEQQSRFVSSTEEAKKMGAKRVRDRVTGEIITL